MTEGGGCGILWENRCLNRRLGLPVDAIANAVLTEAYKCVEKQPEKLSMVMAYQMACM